MERNEGRFDTEKIEPYFGSLTTSQSAPPYVIFEATQDWGRKMVIFSKGNEKDDPYLCDIGSVVEIWSIKEPTDVFSAFQGNRGSSYKRELGRHGNSKIFLLEIEFAFLLDELFVAPRLDDFAELTIFDLTSTLRSSNVFVSQTCWSDFQAFIMKRFCLGTMTAINLSCLWKPLSKLLSSHMTKRVNVAISQYGLHRWKLVNLSKM